MLAGGRGYQHEVEARAAIAGRRDLVCRREIGDAPAGIVLGRGAAPRDRQLAQSRPGAGTAQAEAVGDAEQRTVRGAEYVPAVAVEEAVGPPVERGPAMRAGILIGVDLVALADEEHAEARGIL